MVSPDKIFFCFKNTGQYYEKQKEMRELEKSPHPLIIAEETSRNINSENNGQKNSAKISAERSEKQTLLWPKRIILNR